MKALIAGKCIVIEGHVSETARLILRRFTPDDLPALIEIYADDELRHFIDIGQPQRDARAGATNRLTSNLERYETLGFGQYAVALRVSGAMIGWCGFAYTHALSQNLENADVETAYTIRRDFWHGGYATEAARGALHYGFERLGFEQLVGVTILANEASRRVLEKLGFIREGETNYMNRCVVLHRLTRDAYLNNTTSTEVSHTNT